MDDALELLAASHACGGHSDVLGRWLLAAKGRPLDTPDVIAAADIPASLLKRYLEAPRTTLARQWQALRDQGWHLVTITDTNTYPPLLKQLADPPGMLFLRGNTALLGSPQIAIVGARGASGEGLANARRFARLLANKGFVITSGLALGVDGAAHQAALDNTIAVLGHGPHTLYPARHRQLAERIAEQGLLVTEYPPGLPPRREHFPARNRIISGLSLAVIVVEAAANSGSLITARLAANQGRDIFAIPGSIHNPLSRGCHQLLRDGALWLESVDDLLEHFELLTDTAQAAEDSVCGTE